VQIQGSNVWLIGMQDNSGNTNYNSVIFYVDSIAPAINITYPVNTSYNTNITTLNYSYSDPNLDLLVF